MEKKRKSACLLFILSLVLLFTSFDSPRVLAADDLIYSSHIIKKEESLDNQQVILSSFSSANSKSDGKHPDNPLSLLSSYKDYQVSKEEHNNQLISTPKVEALSILAIQSQLPSTSSVENIFYFLFGASLIGVLILFFKKKPWVWFFIIESNKQPF